MKNIKQKKAVFVLLVLIIVSIFLLINKSKKMAPTVLPTLAIANSVPTNGSIDNSVFNPIEVTFNQPVNSTSLSVFSDPSENWRIVQKRSDSIRIEHEQYLRVATEYKITILHNNILLGTFNFKTATEQNDPRQLQELQSELDSDYPLASYTPHETPDYRVVYSSPLTLEIQLKSTISEQEAILQVNSWVKSHNIDPDTHHYIVKH